jgi:hypothetical protein
MTMMMNVQQSIAEFIYYAEEPILFSLLSKGKWAWTTHFGLGRLQQDLINGSQTDLVIILDSSIYVLQF